MLSIITLGFFTVSCEIDEVEVVDTYLNVSDSTYLEIQDESIGPPDQVFQLEDGTVVLRSFTTVMVKRNNGKEIIDTRSSRGAILGVLKNNFVTEDGAICNSKFEVVDNLGSYYDDVSIGEDIIAFKSNSSGQEQLLVWSETNGVKTYQVPNSGNGDTIVNLLNPVILRGTVFIIIYRHDRLITNKQSYHLLRLDRNLKLLSSRELPLRGTNGVQLNYQRALYGNTRGSEIYLRSDSLYTLNEDGEIINNQPAATPVCGVIMSNDRALSKDEAGGTAPRTLKIREDLRCSSAVLWNYTLPESYLYMSAFNEGINGSVLITATKRETVNGFSKDKQLVYTIDPDY